MKMEPGNRNIRNKSGKKKILPRFSTVPAERGLIFFPFYSSGTELNRNPSSFFRIVAHPPLSPGWFVHLQELLPDPPWKSWNPGWFLVALGRLHKEKVRRDGSSESGREGKEAGAFPTEIPPQVPHDSKGKMNPRRSVLLLTFPIPGGFNATGTAHV